MPGMGSFLYLSRADVEAVGPAMAEMIACVERVFQEMGNGRVEMPPKPGIHTRPNAFIHAMPASIPSLGAAGLKWVSGYPGNQKNGLPYISGLLLLNDPETGLPLAVMDCTWITAKRTGAATAIAAKYLARKDSKSAGIIACGVQGRSNLEALTCLFPIQTVKAYDLHLEIAKQFAHEMGNKLHLEIEPVAKLACAVQQMDLVVSSGPILKDPKPAIEPGWLSAGGFASLVDFDSSWQADAIREVDKLATDDKAQMAYYRRDGYFRTTPTPYADLGEIAAGRKPGRESNNERTMAINLGIGSEDVAAAMLVYRKAREMKIGVELPL